MNQRERYEAHFRQKEIDSFNRSGEGVKDFSGPLAPGVGREAIDSAVKAESAQAAAPTTPEDAASTGLAGAGQKMGAKMAQSGAQQGSMLGTAGGAMMMTGDPYLMAGGLGLSVLASGEQRKRQEEEAQRQAYNDRIKERQAMMAQIAQMGIK